MTIANKTAAVVSALSVAGALAFGGAAVASANTVSAYQRLCKGYDACSLAGMPHYGYKEQSVNRYWLMFKGHNCTNYVAYRLIQNGAGTARPWSGTGNAHNWGHALADKTDQLPTVGSVAWWDSGAGGHGTLGHVAYVEQVISADEIIVSTDNWSGDFEWRRVLKTGDRWPTGFIHIADAAAPAVPVAEASAPTASPKATTQASHPVTSSTTVTLAKKRVKKGSRVKVTVRVNVAGMKSPTGKVVIRDGKKVIKRVTVKTSHKGTVTVKLPKLKVGKHKISVRYAGTGRVKASSSKTVTLRVIR